MVKRLVEDKDFTSVIEQEVNKFIDKLTDKEKEKYTSPKKSIYEKGVEMKKSVETKIAAGAKGFRNATAEKFGYGSSKGDKTTSSDEGQKPASKTEAKGSMFSGSISNPLSGMLGSSKPKLNANDKDFCANIKERLNGGDTTIVAVTKKDGDVFEAEVIKGGEEKVGVLEHGEENREGGNDPTSAAAGSSSAAAGSSSAAAGSSSASSLPQSSRGKQAETREDEVQAKVNEKAGINSLLDKQTQPLLETAEIISKGFKDKLSDIIETAKINNTGIEDKFNAVTGQIKSIIAQHISSVELPSTEDQPDEAEAEAAKQAESIIELATKAGLDEIKLNDSEGITVSEENIEQAKEDIKNKILEAAKEREKLKRAAENEERERSGSEAAENAAQAPVGATSEAPGLGGPTTPQPATTPTPTPEAPGQEGEN